MPNQVSEADWILLLRMLEELIEHESAISSFNPLNQAALKFIMMGCSMEMMIIGLILK